jgi:hypothetical protein
MNYSVSDRCLATSLVANSVESAVKGYAETLVNLPNRSLKWTGRMGFQGDPTHFYFNYTRQLFENGILIRERQWNEKIARDHQ